MGNCFGKQKEFKEHPIIVEELLASNDAIKICVNCSNYILYEEYINNYGYCYKCRFSLPSNCNYKQDK